METKLIVTINTDKRWY